MEDVLQGVMDRKGSVAFARQFIRESGSTLCRKLGYVKGQGSGGTAPVSITPELKHAAEKHS